MPHGGQGQTFINNALEQNHIMFYKNYHLGDHSPLTPTHSNTPYFLQEHEGLTETMGTCGEQKNKYRRFTSTNRSQACEKEL